VRVLCFVKILAINGNSLTKFNEDSVRRINGRFYYCFALSLANIINIVNPIVPVHTTVNTDS